MAITDENGGFFGGDLSIIILFFLFMMMGGWGNGGFGGFGGGDLYPWMNNSQNINDGFRDQMLNNTVTGIQNSITSGFGNVQTALCGGFAGVNASIANGFAQTEIAANEKTVREFNAKTGRWIYTISSYSADNLSKARKDLVKAKEEPKKDEKKPDAKKDEKKGEAKK